MTSLRAVEGSLRRTSKQPAQRVQESVEMLPPVVRKYCAADDAGSACAQVRRAVYKKMLREECGLEALHGLG